MAVDLRSPAIIGGVVVEFPSPNLPEQGRSGFSDMIHRSVSLRAKIGGRMVGFADAEEKFSALVSEWKRLRESGSSTDVFFNDAYGQIAAMSWDAVPFLLREVARQSGHWFEALRWITGEDLVTPEMRGNIREIRAAWLRWGEESENIIWTTHRRLDQKESSWSQDRQAT